MNCLYGRNPTTPLRCHSRLHANDRHYPCYIHAKVPSLIGMLHPPSSASQRIINEPRYLNELADNIASLKIACNFCTSGHTLPVVLPPSWRTIFEHWKFSTCVSARELRSFETSRFEFDSKVTTRLLCRVPSYHKLRSLTVQQKYQPLRRL